MYILACLSFFFYPSSLEKMESTPSWNQASIAKLYQGLHLVTRSSHQRCPIKIVFLIIFCNFINKEALEQVRFPVNFAKFLIKSFLDNTSGRLLLGNALSYSNSVIRQISKPITPALMQVLWRKHWGWIGISFTSRSNVKTIQKGSNEQFGNDLLVCLICLCRGVGNVLNLDNKNTTLSVILQFNFLISEFPVSVRYILRNLSD